MKKYVYVVFSKTLTVPGKIIRKFSGNNYSHSTISLDENLNEMYSFARKKRNNPIAGGFVQENVKTLYFGKEEKLPVKIFKIPVTEKQYRRLRKNINEIKINQDKYMYNTFTLILYPIKVRFNVKNAYICSQFVSTMLKEAGILEKKLGNCYKAPDELVKILEKYEIFDGDLNDYVEKVDHQEYENNFFELENMFFVIAKSIKHMFRLLFRKIIP